MLAQEGLLLGQREMLGTVLYVLMSNHVPDNKSVATGWRAGPWPCCVWPWVLGFRQGLDVALLPGLSFCVSGPALPCFPVLGQTCFA